MVWVLQLIWAGIARVYGWVADLLRWLLEPRHDLGLRTESLYRVRGIVGVACIVVASAYWRPLTVQTIHDRFDAWYNGLWLSAMLSAAAVFLVGLLLLVIAPSGARGTLARALLRPLGAVVGFAAALAGVLAGAFWLSRQSHSSAWSVVLLAVAPVLLIALIAVVVTGVRLAVLHAFRSVDGHPTMRALIYLLVSLYLLVSGLVTALSDRLDAQLPAWAAIAFLIVGPMITIGLSWCELRELRTRYGVQLRTQLPPDWLLSAATR